MAYGQELRMIAAEAEKRESAINRLAFCYDVFLHHTQHGGEPTEHMNAERATKQLCNAICEVIGLPEDN